MKKSVRLSRHVTPERYRLMLKPDLAACSFSGEETIALRLGVATSEIVLHAKGVKVKACAFISGGVTMKPKSILYSDRAETVTFIFPKKLKKGSGELTLAFEGVLNDKMCGFYRSTYHVGGVPKTMATTQFEATDARRAFPCIDEPAAKAIFDVTLMVPGNTTAISNTLPTAVREHDGGYKIVEFAPTPKMSTYLLAFIVGEFEFVETTTKEGVLVRVFVTPGKKHQAEFALEVGAKVLSFYNDYFGIPYPLPVLDMIAIPDFASGAMENWGAVTYRESALLLDPEHSSAHTKQTIAIVVAHELAHQWFGNLVTMEWWTHLWLNEGFASYIEYLAVDHLFPEWDIWTQFVHSDLGSALRLDALRSTHAIEVEVHHPGEIAEIFDAVSYQKGASIIRMLADYLGEQDFRDGLRHYLKKHSYANAKTEDLWLAFEQVAKKPVRAMMRGWTGAEGYPVLTLTEAKGKLQLTQMRFFSSPLERRLTKTRWQIPVRLQYSLKKGSELHFVESQTLAVRPRRKGEWLKVNAGENGFFRVDYPVSYLEALRKPIAAKLLPTRDRMGIIRDVHSLAEAGLLRTDEALSMTAAYRNETDYSVWTTVLSRLDRLNNLIASEPYAPHYQKYLRDLLAPLAHRVGFVAKKGESHSTTLLRSDSLLLLGSVADLATVRFAKKTFAALRKGKAINPDLRSVVFTTVAASGGAKEHAALMKLYRETHLGEEKARLGWALGCFKSVTLLQKSLDFSRGADVRPQDAPSIISSVMKNPAGKELGWNFVTTQWKWIMAKFGGSHLLSRLLEPLGLQSNPERAKEIAAFFKRHPAPSAARRIDQVLERIGSNAAWLARDGRKIAEWLRYGK